MEYQLITLTTGKVVSVRAQTWTEYTEQMKLLFEAADAMKDNTQDAVKNISLAEMDMVTRKLSLCMQDPQECAELSRNEATELSKKIDDIGKAELEAKN